MATFFDLRRVQILCSCDRSCPLSQLYFCRHCYDVRCGNCVSHEVDSHYCPNCLENMASAEAKMRRHRCGNCFDCPSCGQTLSTRATLALVPPPAGSAAGDASKTTPQKAYYLTCGFCRWSTRDSGIPDQKTPAGGWHETLNPHESRIDELVAAYRQLAVKEKNERERNKCVRKRNYMLLMERYPVLTPRFRRCRTPVWSSFGRDAEPGQEITIPGAQAHSIDGTFDIDKFVKIPLNFATATSVFQRYMMPQLQQTEVAKLEPRHKALAVKRSLRCRKCEHNLSKADFNPSAIKFRINLSAFQHVPDLRICLASQNITTVATKNEAYPQGIFLPPDDANAGSSLMLCPQRKYLPVLTFASVPPEPLSLEGFSVGSKTHIILTLCNPAHRLTTVHLKQLAPEKERARLVNFFGSQSSNKRTGVNGINEHGLYSTVQLTLPSKPVCLAAKSDVTEYDDLAVTTSNEFTDDDPKVIAFRRGNKVGLNVAVTPLALNPDTKVDANALPLRAFIQMTFDYKNATTSMLSEQRASTTNAVLAASGIQEEGNKVEFPVTAASTPADIVHNIDVFIFIDLGETSLA